MTRRSDQEFVEALIQFLKGKKGTTITRGELCDALNINARTAEKWLRIGHMFKNDCPDYVYEQAGRFWIIRMIYEKVES